MRFNAVFSLWQSLWASCTYQRVIVIVILIYLHSNGKCFSSFPQGSFECNGLHIKVARKRDCLADITLTHSTSILFGLHDEQQAGLVVSKTLHRTPTHAGWEPIIDNNINKSPVKLTGWHIKIWMNALKPAKLQNWPRYDGVHDWPRQCPTGELAPTCTFPDKVPATFLSDKRQSNTDPKSRFGCRGGIPGRSCSERQSWRLSILGERGLQDNKWTSVHQSMASWGTRQASGLSQWENQGSPPTHEADTSTNAKIWSLVDQDPSTARLCGSVWSSDGG